MISRTIQRATPSTIILACGLGAAALGGLYLALARAPSTYLLVNGGAGLLGGLLVLASRAPILRKTGFDTAVWGIVSAVVLLLTALFGTDIESARRWLAIGPLQIQPGLIVVPAIALMLARKSTLPMGLSIGLISLALALQPDRAIAGALAAGLFGLLVWRRDAVTIFSALFASLAFVGTLIRPDELPAVTHVEGVYQAAFESGGVASLIVVLGTIVLVAPAGLALSARRDLKPAGTVFGLTWLSLIIAALVGNYPTPLLGYGSSSIVGYLLCAIAFQPTYPKTDSVS